MFKKILCIYCATDITFSVFQNTEHLVPISKGGANNADNRRACCKGCNFMRGDMELTDFLKHIEILSWNNPQNEVLRGMIPRIKSAINYVNQKGDRLLKRTNK